MTPRLPNTTLHKPHPATLGIPNPSPQLTPVQRLQRRRYPSSYDVCNGGGPRNAHVVRSARGSGDCDLRGGYGAVEVGFRGPAELSVLNGRSCMSSLVESRGAVGWTVGGD